MKLAYWGLLILLGSPLATASAQEQASPSSGQQQTDALAAAARRTQEQKKDQKKAAKVWDNDNLPTTPGAVSVVGQAPAAAPANGEAQVDTVPANQPTAPESTFGEKPAEHVDVGALQAQLKSLRNDLDIMQRKYTLDQQTYYGTTNYAADKAGAASLADEKSQIDAKQQQIDDIQKTLDNLH